MKINNRLIVFLIIGFVFMISNVTMAKPHVFISEVKDFRIGSASSPALNSIGITKEYIKKYIELLCLRQSLPAKTTDSNYQWLVANVAADPIVVNGKKIGYACIVSLSFEQGGKTLTTNQRSLITSWNPAPITFITQEDRIKSDIKEALKEQIEVFELIWKKSHR